MQAAWLKQNDHNDLIVIFGGWALGAEMFRHLTASADLLFVDDYRDLDGLPDLSTYQARTAIAYSFGVAAFAHLDSTVRDQFDHCVAINGSPAPVDRRLGIPPVVFQKTLDGLSIESFQSFASLSFGEGQTELLIDVKKRAAELEAVKQRGPAECPIFDRIWISQNDRIFPAANLARVFADQSDAVRTIEAPHVPFARWKTWQEVLA